MYGRVCLRLLAFSLVIVAAFSLAQSNEAESARRFVRPILPRMPLPVRPSPDPPGTYGLPQLARSAGIIFSGTVIGIKTIPATAGQTLETVAITFCVETAIRGTTPGDVLTVRQWMGLWSSGQRHRLGEHVFLFLYPRSKIGLTSCVGAALGRFNVGQNGRVVLSSQQISAFERDPALGGKSPVRLSDFALAVRQASEEE